MLSSYQIHFYDNSILSVTKIEVVLVCNVCIFYDNSILSVTKMSRKAPRFPHLFYDNSILSVTKIGNIRCSLYGSFTITQFFQLLKCQIAEDTTVNTVANLILQ